MSNSVGESEPCYIQTEGQETERNLSIQYIMIFFFRYLIEEGGERARVVPDHRGGQHSAGAGGAPGAGHLLLLLQEGKQRCVDWTNDKIFQSLSF